MNPELMNVIDSSIREVRNAGEKPHHIFPHPARSVFERSGYRFTQRKRVKNKRRSPAFDSIKAGTALRGEIGHHGIEEGKAILRDAQAAIGADHDRTFVTEDCDSPRIKRAAR